MSDIYANIETGKKIKVYEATDVHVWDEDDPSFDFRDTAKGVAEWCWENVDRVDLEDDENIVNEAESTLDIFKKYIEKFIERNNINNSIGSLTSYITNSEFVKFGTKLDVIVYLGLFTFFTP